MKMHPKKLRLKNVWLNGCGDFSSNIMYSAMAAFLLFYYTDVVGVSAAAVGVIMMCSRLFDGVSDLIMGVIIDRTKSPFGKAKDMDSQVGNSICNWYGFAVSQFRQDGVRLRN